MYLAIVSATSPQNPRCPDHPQIAPLVSSHFSNVITNESVVLVWGCTLMVGNTLTSPYRAAWAHWNWPGAESHDDDLSYVNYDDER